MSKDHGLTIKNDEQYEALRNQGMGKGMGKSKAARIANTPNSGEKGGHAEKYEDRTKNERYAQAKKIGISGRSKMSKKELIETLRNE